MSLYVVESQVNNPCLLCKNQVNTHNEHIEVHTNSGDSCIHVSCWDEYWRENG